MTSFLKKEKNKSAKSVMIIKMVEMLEREKMVAPHIGHNLPCNLFHPLSQMEAQFHACIFPQVKIFKINGES